MSEAENAILMEHIGIIRGVTASYAGGFSQDRWDDLFGVAMEGASAALGTFDPIKGNIKDHIVRGCRNYILNELRRIKRWSNEVPTSPNECVIVEEDEELDFIEDFIIIHGVGK